MLEVKNIQAGYGQLRVLFGIGLTVAPGEVVAIQGANGAGKSTLLKTILGAMPATGGEITFMGERVTHLPAHRRVQAGIALSPEGRQVCPTLSVRDNLIVGSYGLRNRSEIKAQIDHVFTLFPLLEERSSQRAGSLSGGEQQMLAISRALMSRPQLLMVDELSLGLAPIIVEKIYDALRELCDKGLSVIVVEQMHHFLAGHADKQFLLEKGRFVGDEEASEIEEVMSLSTSSPS